MSQFFTLNAFVSAFSHSGTNPSTLRGSKTGLFLGLHTNELDIAMHDHPKLQPNGYTGQLAVKLANYFDFRGQVCTFDSACSSGFVALHSAVTSLQLGIIDQAVVCASNISIHPANSLVFIALRMLSPTGYLRFLDANADGYVKSEACSAIFLQRDSVSLRNYASILAIKTNSDGFKREGITFPSSKQQETLIRETKEMLGIHSDHVEYLEFHGTGTQAGDPQEARAVSEVYCSTEQRTTGPLLVGSVKTNMGHSEGVSGLCSLAKVILMFENDIIYKSLHYAKANPNIASLLDGRVKLVDENRRLNSKIVPINCYGFGGANVHGIFRANSRDIVRKSENDSKFIHANEQWRLVLMFGRNEDPVVSFFDAIMSDKRKDKTLTRDFLALVDSLCKGPIDRLMKYRGFSMVDLKIQKELYRSVAKCELLPAEDDRTYLNCTRDLGRPRRHFQDSKTKYCYFVYSGLSTPDWSSMKGFINNLQDFDSIWSTIEELNDILKPLDYDLLEVLMTKAKILNTREASIIDTFVAVTAIQIALTNLLKSNLNLIPTGGLICHGLGEIACAYAGKTLHDREAILLAYYLAQFLQLNEQSIQGSIVSLNVGLNAAQKLIGLYYESALHQEPFNTLYVSYDDGPNFVTLSGRKEEVKHFVEYIDNSQQEDEKIIFKMLDFQYAIHNPYIMNDDKKSELVDYLNDKLFGHSNNSDSEFDNNEQNEDSTMESRMTYVEQFAHNLCHRVCFRQSIDRILENSVLIQIGSFTSNSICLKELLPSDKNITCINLFKSESSDSIDDRFTLFSSIGNMFLLGLQIDLSLLYPSCELPVRRQVPSISSLIKWDHSDSFFLPKYPEQFSCTLATSDIPIDLMEERYEYLTGHNIDGRVLYPATGFLYQVWRILSNINNCGHQNEDGDDKLIPVEFHNVRLFRAVILSAGIVTHLSIILERGTGRFKITEGGSIVMDGIVRLPVLNPDGLLYEDIVNKIRSEKLDSTLNHSDVYRQFRLGGYDYGETFSCIQSASSDGRFARIKYNGKLVSLTDNVLQTIFLAICCQSPFNSLFLPTGFDYVRFNPAMIFEKINSSACSTTRIQTEAERMERTKEKSTSDHLKHLSAVGEQPSSIGHENESVMFDAFCELETGIIVTDGIEMRGVKASPAPRRELLEPLLECYKFIPDIEEPVRESVELCNNSSREQYCKVCTTVVRSLVSSMKQPISLKIELFNKLLDFLDDGQQLLDTVKLEKYLNENLKCRRCNSTSELNGQQQIGEAKNEPFSLLALLDSLSNIYALQLSNRKNHATCLDYIAIIETLKSALLQARKEHCESSRMVNDDFILSCFHEERFIRPIVETIIENSCQTTNKLSMLEINMGDNLLFNQFKRLIDDIAPNVSLDYTLAHEDHHRLKQQLRNNLPNNIKWHSLRYVDHEGESSLLSPIDDGVEVDVLCYYDSSCYSPLFDVQSDAKFKNILSMFQGIIRKRGFLVVMMRHQYTLAELFIMVLSQLDTTQYKRNGSQYMLVNDDIIEKMVKLQLNCRERVLLLQKEATKCKMVLTGKKMDTTGCTLFMFQNYPYRQSLKIDFSVRSPSISDPNFCDNRIIHMKHADCTKWLNQLKEQFFGETIGNNDRKKMADYSRVWLCFVATKDDPINGIIGMVQCLRKELGSRNVRCFFDCYTFKTKLDSEVCLDDILMSKNFALALKKDMLWNCIDSSGSWGSFRHLALDGYFDHVDENIFLLEQKKTECPYKMPTTGAYADVSIRGDLSSFKWHQTPFSYLSPNERKQLVEVHYSALNFRDIMLATGRLLVDALPGKMATTSDCLLGLEFSGFDTYRNKRVAGMLSGRGIATHVLCPEHMSIKFDIPESMSLKEAATIPVVYATAIMALIHRGKMKSGETILIHAGSGGVGQAAIRLAIYHDVKVFTTVGSQEKRNFLLEEFGCALKSDQIFDSRNCSFEEQIMRATNGRGVDLILNSLAEDKLQASLRCLADNGRFLEIGKYDLAINSPLELLHLNSNKSFHGILLDKLFEPETMSELYKKQVNCVLETLTDGLYKGYVKPIRHTCFPRDQLEQAFRFMATGKHIGKVLIEIKPEIKYKQLNCNSNGVACDSETKEKQECSSLLLKTLPRFQLDPSKTYIITGGLGGFGLELVKWLACVGGKHFVLTSRSGLTSGSCYKRSVLERLEKNLECKFLVVNNDMADGTTLEGVEIIFDLAKQLSPVEQIGGIFHLAMVLKDSLLENITSDHFDLVCKPKARACMLLDEVSRKKSPEMSLFVAFSSVSCGKGNAGQTNYGYANSILERICEQRRKDNIHGLAIQWGPIGDVGIAYENFKSNDIVIGGLIIPQRINSCLATLAKLLCTPFAVCSSTIRFDSQKRNNNGQLSNTKGDLVKAVLHVLGVKDASKLSDQTSLGELGLDSLMAVEIRQYIERELEITLNVQEIRSLTIEKIKEIEQKSKRSLNKKSQCDNYSSNNSNLKTEEAGEALEKHMGVMKSLGLKFHSGFDSAFKPQLDLPKTNVVHLNSPDKLTGKRRPIFLLTHIHGDFERLELISKNIKRPCIGLNWTRELGKVNNFAEAASFFVDVLENLVWIKFKQTEEHSSMDESRRVVDLIGYSFGATLSFEILLLIQDRRRKSQSNLEPGRLILLDMSPKLTESLGDLSGSLLVSNIDEVLTFYIAHHAKHLEIDFQTIRNRIASVDESLEAKFEFTCEILSQMLNLEGNDWEKRDNLLHAIVAFHKRYQVLFSYKARGLLKGDVTLLRSKEKLFTVDSKSLDANDYNLSEVSICCYGNQKQR